MLSPRPPLKQSSYVRLLIALDELRELRDARVYPYNRADYVQVRALKKRREDEQVRIEQDLDNVFVEIHARIHARREENDD